MSYNLLLISSSNAQRDLVKALFNIVSRPVANSKFLCLRGHGLHVAYWFTFLSRPYANISCKKFINFFNLYLVTRNIFLT